MADKSAELAIPALTAEIEQLVIQMPEGELRDIAPIQSRTQACSLHGGWHFGKPPYRTGQNEAKERNFGRNTEIDCSCRFLQRRGLDAKRICGDSSHCSSTWRVQITGISAVANGLWMN